MALCRLLLASSLWLSACAQQQPTVPDPGRAADAGIVYADIVLAFTDGGQPQTCQQGLPACDQEPGEPCGPTAVLGPPDDVTHVLEAGGRIDLGFRCGAVVERGGEASPDMKIWADVGPDASAVVEMSLDGITYEPWIELTQSDQDLDLARIDQQYLRYIRIADTGGGGISIDAVEGI